MRADQKLVLQSVAVRIWKHAFRISSCQHACRTALVFMPVRGAEDWTLVGDCRLSGNRSACSVATGGPGLHFPLLDDASGADVGAAPDLPFRVGPPVRVLPPITPPASGPESELPVVRCAAPDIAAGMCRGPLCLQRPRSAAALRPRTKMLHVDLEARMPSKAQPSFDRWSRARSGTRLLTPSYGSVHMCSWDAVASSHGLLLLTDHMHPSERGARLVEAEVRKNFLREEHALLACKSLVFLPVLSGDHMHWCNGDAPRAEPRRCARSDRASSFTHRASSAFAATS